MGYETYGPSESTTDSPSQLDERFESLTSRIVVYSALSMIFIPVALMVLLAMSAGTRAGGQLVMAALSFIFVISGYVILITEAEAALMPWLIVGLVGWFGSLAFLGGKA